MLRFFAFHFSHHDDQRKKLLARNRHQATRAIGARLAGQHRRRRSWRGFLRTFRCAHARETRRERRRVRIGNIWLGRQFAQRRHGSHRHEAGEENIDCNFSRCGHLEVACKQAHFDGYEESAALVKREFNHELRIIPKSELRAEIGSDIYFGGMVDETSAGLNPAQYVAGLAHAAQRAGACLYAHTRVAAIEQETNNGARKFRVQTSKGATTARELILASGAYTTEATPALRKKIIPIGSYIIATPDHRMLFGGRAAFFPETENTVRQSAEILRRGMIAVYPQLRDAKVEFVWGGTLDFTLDVMPHAGKLDDMYFAAGFAGHGVAAATWFGAKLAGLICGDPNDIPFDGIPFRGAPLGLRSGHTWALPLAGAWYKILDFLT